SGNQQLKEFPNSVFKPYTADQSPKEFDEVQYRLQFVRAVRRLGTRQGTVIFLAGPLGLSDEMMKWTVGEAAKLNREGYMLRLNNTVGIASTKEVRFKMMF